MGVVELKKAELYYHRSVQEDVTKILQYSGSCQIIKKAEHTETTPGEVENLLRLCEEQQAHIRYLFRTLGVHYADPVSSIDRMLGEKPVLSMAELEETAQRTNLAELVSFVKKTETELNGMKLENARLKMNASLLRNIGDFPWPLSVFTEGTRTVKGVLGSLPAVGLEAFQSALKAGFSAESELYVSSGIPGSKDIWIAVLYARTHEAQILELCGRNGVSVAELPSSFRGGVSEESATLAGRIAGIEEEEARLLQSLKDTAQENMGVVQLLSDYWNTLSERYRVLTVGDATAHTIKTGFWVPAEVLPRLQKKLEAASPNIELEISDPTGEDNPPTLLTNRPVVKPFEILTSLYSLPPYGETDPTPLLAPFFFVFFGMCLGDAGYAVIMLGLFWMLFAKYRRMPPAVKGFVLLFVLGSVSTLAYGVISGSFFGDFIDSFEFMAWLRPAKNALMLIDPMNNPMTVLGISMVLGLIHLMFGLAVGAYDHIRKKNYADAFGDKISWILFIVGLVLWFIGGSMPSVLHFLTKLMTLIGMLGIFWYAGREKSGIFSKLSAGFLALYGATSYLGDVLSYSRLLALGFGSAVIGMVINLMGGMAAGIPYIGWLIAVAVIMGGHIFGILINVLGAFVHSLRLQYVEFFGKFYTGGGSPFTPLTISGQYVEVSDKLR